MVFKEQPLVQFAGALMTMVGMLHTRYAGNAHDLAAAWMVLLIVLATIGLISLGRYPSYYSRIGWLLVPPFYIGLPLTALALLHAEPEGAAWVVLALTLAFVGDTGGYVVGSLWGTRKLAPTISPNKTVQGAAGGLMGSLIAAVIAHVWYLPSVSWIGALGLGFVGGVAAQVGDLFESLIKRGFSIKDSSQLIPGHGGLLDRLDAVIFTSVVTWLYVGYVH